MGEMLIVHAPPRLSATERWTIQVKVLMMCLHENIVPLLGIATDPW